MNWSEWYVNYMTNRMNQERLGQAFCNDFIRYPWPELYYCENAYESYNLIWNLLESTKDFDPFADLKEYA